MSGPQRVVWSEGLLMAPAHLQQLDAYHEHLLTSRLDGIERYNWGALAVELDARALGRREVQLARFQGVLPDGTVLQLETGDAALPPSRAIDPHFPHTQHALDVYLALPRERAGYDNFASTEASKAEPRYRALRRKVYDAGANGRDAEVAFAAPSLSLRFGGESREDFVSLKIAEIVRDDSGGLVVCDPYIPPCLRISASPFLMASLRRLLAAMGTRHKALSAARRQSGDGSIEFNAADVTRFLLLNTINGFIPVLAHLAESGDVSPRAAYLVLSQLAGQLATFSPDVDPTTLPRFAFFDLRSTFEELFGRTTAMLWATVAEHFVSLPLQGRDDGMHTGVLDAARTGACDRFFLAIKTDLPEQQTAARVPQLAKVASFREIQGILSAATPGAPLEVTFRPPPEIPVRAGHVYFAIATDNPYFHGIRNDGNIAVYLPPFFDPGSTHVELMAVPRRSATSHAPQAL